MSHYLWIQLYYMSPGGPNWPEKMEAIKRWKNGRSQDIAAHSPFASLKSFCSDCISTMNLFIAGPTLCDSTQQSCMTPQEWPSLLISGKSVPIPASACSFFASFLGSIPWAHKINFIMISFILKYIEWVYSPGWTLLQIMQS